MSELMSINATYNLIKNVLDKQKKMAENIKEPKLFDISYVPDEIYIRKELEEVATNLAEYLVTGVPNNIIVFGYKGSGKTTSILNLLEVMKKNGNEKMDYTYLNAKQNPTSFMLLRAILGDVKISFSMADTIKTFSKHYKEMKEKGIERYVVIIDEADFLKDDAIYYMLSRETNINLVILTRKMQWLATLDESVKSSLQPIYVHFNSYEIAEIKTILEMRAKEGLYEYNEGFLNLLNTRLYREHNSDIRIGIRCLLLASHNNSWQIKDVDSILKKAAEDVESSTIREMKDTELIVLRSLLQDTDTNKGYGYAVMYMDKILAYHIEKKQFFNLVHSIEATGLFSTVKKRVGKYYTLEVVGLSQYENLIKNEFDRRFRTHSEVVVN